LNPSGVERTEVGEKKNRDRDTAEVRALDGLSIGPRVV
jgi:hypothetical protein